MDHSFKWLIYVARAEVNLVAVASSVNNAQTPVVALRSELACAWVAHLMMKHPATKTALMNRHSEDGS